MAARVDYVNFKAGKRRTKSKYLPGFNGDVVFGGSMVRVLRQSFAVATHVHPSQVKDARTKPFDASNLSLNVSNGRHVGQLRVA
jgi:hypothetical protein